MNTYTLVAINWSGNCDELDLVKQLGDAIISWSLDLEAVPGKDAFRFLIKNAELRNTVAHGIGCDLGFVCHIDYDSVVSA